MRAAGSGARARRHSGSAPISSVPISSVPVSGVPVSCASVNGASDAVPSSLLPSSGLSAAAAVPAAAAATFAFLRSRRKCSGLLPQRHRTCSTGCSRSDDYLISVQTTCAFISARLQETFHPVARWLSIAAKNRLEDNA